MSGRYKTLKTYHNFPDGERWLRNSAVKHSEDVAKQKRISLEQFDAFLYQEDWELNDVNNLILEEFSLWLDDVAGIAHSTISKRWYAVRQYLNDHIDPSVGHLEDDENYILKWLDKGTETAKQEDKKIHWLPLEKIPQLIGGASNHPIVSLRNKLVVQLLWNTGCRPSEIARMKLRRHNFNERSITVRTSKVTDTDADNYERTVYYSNKTRKTMREYLKMGGRQALSGSDDSAHLIVGYNSESIDARQVNDIVRQAANQAGIQEDMIETAATNDDGETISNNRVVPKTLRHSFAVHSIRGRELSGTDPMNLETLRILMGHREIKSTRHYLQFKKSTTGTEYDQSFPG